MVVSTFENSTWKLTLFLISWFNPESWKSQRNNVYISYLLLWLGHSACENTMDLFLDRRTIHRCRDSRISFKFTILFSYAHYPAPSPLLRFQRISFNCHVHLYIKPTPDCSIYSAIYGFTLNWFNYILKLMCRNTDFSPPSSSYDVFSVKSAESNWLKITKYDIADSIIKNCDHYCDI